jgi:hypothetical protein
MNENTFESKELEATFDAKEFAAKFLELDNEKIEAVKKAIGILNAEYGEDSSHPTLEGLFSADSFERINPDTATDENTKTWRESQSRYLSDLRQELINAQDQVSVDAAARNLADHMINL